jgi:hypothetical protein
MGCTQLAAVLKAALWLQSLFCAAHPHVCTVCTNFVFTKNHKMIDMMIPEGGKQLRTEYFISPWTEQLSNPD